MTPIRIVVSLVSSPVIVTNKTTAAGNVARFHEAWGYQEKIYGELKN